MATLVRTELGSPEFWEQLRTDPKALAAAVCQIDLSALNQELQAHPALRAWVNTAHETTRIEEERAKWEVTKAHASALFRAKGSNDALTNKPKNVEVLKAESEIDPDVVEKTEKLLGIQERRAVLRAISEALDDRLQMLIQISANQRAEHTDYERK